MFPTVAIVIVNWNRREDTLACLDSLTRLDYPNYHPIVVDNASGDGSAGAIRSAFPQVTLLEAGTNLGFVGGSNLGLAQARRQAAGYAWLLNNDTLAAPGSLRRLVEAVEADPQAGVAGPAIYYHDRPDTIWSAGGAIDWQRGRTRMLGLNEVDAGREPGLPHPVDFVTGCALLARMQVFDRVGPLEERFFAYYEETEWCVRAARAGYRILQVPVAKIWHKIALEEREASPQVLYYMVRNRLLFLKLTHPGIRPWLGTLWDYAYRLVRWTVLPKWRHKAGQRKVMLRAIVDFWRGRYGKMELEHGG